MFKLLYKNNKGFSLVELLTTVVVLGIAMGLAGSILYIITNSYNAASYRWEVQNAVQLASTKFETRTDLIANSKMLDIFYDETVAGGIIYDKENRTFTWKNGGSPYVFPAEGSKDDDYSYIFSTEAYSTEGEYLGYYLFIKNFGETKSELFLDEEGMGETPIKIELSVATDFIPPVVTKNAGESKENFEKRKAQLIETEKNKKEHSYQSNGVRMLCMSGNEEILSYEVETFYTLENHNPSKQVGMESGQLILDSSWVSGGVAKAYPCGWSDTYINTGNKEMHGYPKMATNYGTNNANVYNFSTAQLEKIGNVLRFLSPLSDMKVEDGEAQGTTSHKASCIQTWLFSDGTASSERVLDNFRNFRDNVLRGTTIGDWFIDFYYNDLSPFMIENTAFLRPVLKAFSKPLSYVCDFIAKL